ncbi:MAG: ABC transporter permease [Eubacteriales bacterium]|nr:ABC transporter permease [Eubacteriales bacterium]
MQVYITAIEEGFLYGLLALGVYISLRILDIPDLTTEGSFGFGSAVAAVVASQGFSFLSFLAAFAAGVLAGVVTGLLQTKLKVHPVLAGIITMSGLYSINLMVRGSSNLNFNDNSVFTRLFKALGVSGADKKIVGLIVGAIICIIVLVLVIIFFRTHLGLCIRATGDNPDMVKASSVNVDFSLIFGLALANGLIALSGALISHYLGLSDQSFSNGTLIYGLAAVIIGEAIFGKRSVALGFTSAVVGSVVYKIIMAFVIDVSLFGKNSENLMKLTCAIIVAATLVIPEIKNRIKNSKVKKEAKKNA